MPNCSKCNGAQAKLNKGALCKSCNEKKIDINKNNDSIENEINGENCENVSNDRTVLEIIKEHMMQEKKWIEEFQKSMKDQIDFLKCEIDYKNKLIKDIMAEWNDLKCQSKYYSSPIDEKKNQ